MFALGFVKEDVEALRDDASPVDYWYLDRGGLAKTHAHQLVDRQGPVVKSGKAADTADAVRPFLAPYLANSEPSHPSGPGDGRRNPRRRLSTGFQT
jgi:hypothetical protein